MRMGTEGRDLAVLGPKSQSLNQGREGESPMGRRDDSRPRFSRARTPRQCRRWRVRQYRRDKF